MKSAFLLAALTSVSLLAACQSTPGSSSADTVLDERLSNANFEASRQAISRDRAMRQQFISQCASETRPSDVDRRNMAVLMNVAPGAVPAAFCQRIVQGVINGSISANDVQKGTQGEITAPVLRALQAA